MKMLDGLGVRWGSGDCIFKSGATKYVVDGNLWVFFDPESWDLAHASISWCEGHTEYLHLSLDHFKNLVEDYLYEHQ